MSNIKRGSSPSIANIQKLATYLGCTVSELLGEKIGPAAQLSDRAFRAALQYDLADEKAKTMVDMLLSIDAVPEVQLAARGGRTVKPDPSRSQAEIQQAADKAQADADIENERL